MEKRKEEKEGEKEGLDNLLNSRQGLGSLVRRGGAWACLYGVVRS